MRYTGNPEEAKAVLNQAFLTIFQRLDQYAEQGSFIGWMSTITFRTAINHLRREGRHHRVLSIDQVLPTAVPSLVEGKLAAEFIYTQIQLLPDHLRTVFSLHVIEGYSHRDISELLEISESNSRWRLAKAREKLRSALGPHYEQNGRTA